MDYAYLSGGLNGQRKGRPSASPLNCAVRRGACRWSGFGQEVGLRGSEDLLRSSDGPAVMGLLGASTDW